METNPMPKDDYNYDHFALSTYANSFQNFPGPKAGEPMVNFKARDLSGKCINFSDFQGRYVVLETGSFTCPMYVRGIKAMNKLAKKYSDVVFLVLYVREAHPGYRTPAHKNLYNKLENARKTQTIDKEERVILIDGLDGQVHTILGGLPNMIYFVGPTGKIIFRGNWNDIKVLKKILSHKFELPIYSQELFRPKNPSPWTALKVLLRGGWIAVWEFIIVLPTLLNLHRGRNKKSLLK